MNTNKKCIVCGELLSIGERDLLMDFHHRCSGKVIELALAMLENEGDKNASESR